MPKMANGSEDLIMASAEAGEEPASATQRSDPRQMSCGKEFPQRGRSVYVADGYCTCFIPKDQLKK